MNDLVTASVLCHIAAVLLGMLPWALESDGSSFSNTLYQLMVRLRSFPGEAEGAEHEDPKQT